MPAAVLVEDFADGDEGGLGVEGIEDGFDEQEVDAAGDEGANLVLVGGLDLVEGDDAEACVVGVGGVGERDGERADGSGDEALAVGCVGEARSATVRHWRAEVSLMSQASCVEELVFDDLLVEGRVFAAAGFAGVVDEEFGLGDAGGAEGVGLEDVGAGLEEAADGCRRSSSAG